jgi:hypothetical protein
MTFKNGSIINVTGEKLKRDDSCKSFRLFEISNRNEFLRDIKNGNGMEVNIGRQAT